jgi:hypothetical protein
MIGTVQKKRKDWKKLRRNNTEKFSENNSKNSGILKTPAEKEKDRGTKTDEHVNGKGNSTMGGSTTLKILRIQNFQHGFREGAS